MTTLPNFPESIPDPIEGVIFDLDGTIVDRDRLVVHCTLEVAKSLLGKTLNPDRISWGLHETDTIRRLTRQLSQDRSKQARDAYTDCLKTNLKMWEVFPGIPGLLERLGKSPNG